MTHRPSHMMQMRLNMRPCVNWTGSSDLQSNDSTLNSLGDRYRCAVVNFLITILNF